MRRFLLHLLALCPLLTVFSQAEPVSLFDGQSLDHWDFDPAMWRIEEGVITGGSTSEKIKKNDFISTKQSFQNFELKLKIKVSGDPKTGMLNSGIQIRSLRDGTAMAGYQIDCGAGWFGKIYDEHRRNKVIWSPTPEQQAALDKTIDTFGWNEYRIRAEGPRIQTWINGVLCIDYTETDPNIALDGHIAPQVHSGGVCLVQVKDITIEELPPTPGVPTWKSIGGLEGMKAKLPPKPKPTANGKPNTNTNKPKRDISYNAVEGTALTAQEQLKKFKLPEGYEIELVVQESAGLGKFVSVYFDQRGRLWTQTALEYPIDANENPAAAEAAYKAHGKDKVLVFQRESLNSPLPPEGLTNPTVFAEGLAIPLGILPWGNGDTCYVQHGHDLKLYKDTNGDGKADTFDIVLTGFGVQDSHLFPHQFTRAPGGWIWMAQGLFNNSQVRKPGSDTFVDWPKCSMARMRPDGSEFEVISTGPNNIWGLVITGEGETFIQEANDYGYPVMPFHEYAYYPGGMEALKKSYQPDFPPMTDIRMGGTGLSGLALIEGSVVPPLGGSETSAAAKPTHTMAVANPITSQIQTLAMHRDGPYWKLEQLPDLVTCDDPFFRPVALTNGPDGCIYIVDWYNKIISHNEVPRAHPDRDKTRGRIWRVKPKATKTEVADFTKTSTEELVAILGTEPTARAHLAGHTIVDRWKEHGVKHMFQDPELIASLTRIVADQNLAAPKRIQALWTLDGMNIEIFYPATHLVDFATLLNDSNPRIRLAAMEVRSGETSTIDLILYGSRTVKEDAPARRDPSPEIRQSVIKAIGRGLKFAESPEAVEGTQYNLRLILRLIDPSLPNGPTTASSRAPKQIPVREAYDREFERFLVRMFLERHPDLTAKFLDSEAASALPIEARVLASLALDPKASASRVAKLLPQLDRAPNDEELLRLAQFPTEPGVAEALTALLTHETSRAAVAEKLLTHRTKLDPKQIAPLLTTTARDMLHRDADTPVRILSLQLISGFQLTTLEPDLVTLARSDGFQPSQKPALLTTLRDLRSAESSLFATLAESDPDPLTRAAALEALAASRAPDAPAKLLSLFPKLTPAQRKNALSTLSATQAGASTIVAALLDKSLSQSDLDAPTIERLATVLGNDPALQKLQTQLGGIFGEVLLLDGSDDAWIDSKITLDGPFTVEAWVRLAPGIGNEDSLLGVPGGLQLNFFGSKFRAYAGPELHDVAASTKPMTPDLWTHLAVTRDATGIIRLYQNGELDATATKPAPAKWENCRIGWSGPAKGTEGFITEFRVWKTARTPQEIRTTFDRSVVPASAGHSDAPQLPLAQTLSPATIGQGARLAKTLDLPPLLTEAQALALDTKFASLTALAAKGDPTAGKPFAALCIACHQIGSSGGQIGPNLSGVGAMGLEAILRNILTPNAAMEPGYRIYRVELQNGDLIDAFYVSEDKDAIVIRLPGAPDRRLPRAEVARTQFIRRSLMPEGLLDALPEKAAADLLAYLLTLKG